MQSIAKASPRTILKDLPHQGYANLTSFLKDRFLPTQEQDRELDVLAVAQLNNLGAKVGIISTSLPNPFQCGIKGLASGAPYGVARTFRDAKSTNDSVVLMRGQASKGTMTINIGKIDFDSGGIPTFRDWPLQYKCNIATDVSSILVGDALGLGYHQVFVLALDFEGINFGIFGSPSDQDADIQLLGLHRSSFSQDMELVNPIFTALIPTSTTNLGFDVLYVSHHKIGSQFYLIFRTFTRAAPQPGVPGEDACPYGAHFKEPLMVADDLASGSTMHYFSMKWMPVQYQTADGTTCRGVLEIYSWYGVLGVRIFGAGNSGWGYELLGRLPYLGRRQLGLVWEHMAIGDMGLWLGVRMMSLWMSIYLRHGVLIMYSHGLRR